MHVFISGGTGFIGTQLTAVMLERGYRVTAAARAKNGPFPENEAYRYIRADLTREGLWQDAVTGADAVVNLAGATIFRAWTERYKRTLRESRVVVTRRIVEAMGEKKGQVLFSASGAGYYGDRGDDVLLESAPAGSDFLAELAVEWEGEAFKARDRGARVTVGRFGVVLDRSGGAMDKMVPAFRMFVGGSLGDGSQWFPWIHLQDLTSAVCFLLETPAAEGAFNFSAPQPVRNRDLARALGRRLNRPSALATPSLVMKLLLGDLAQVFLASQRAVPDHLQRLGFEFRYPDIETALAELVRETA